MTHAVHLLRQLFLADQRTVAAQQHQARLHCIEIHHLAAIGLGADTAIGDDQGFVVRHPQQLVRADTMGGVLAYAHQLAVFQAIDAKHATAGIGGVVFGGVEPLAVLVKHPVPIKVTLGRRGHDLQQATVTRVDQVALAARATADEHRQGQVRVRVDVMAAFGDRCGEHLAAIEAVADGVVLPVGAITRGEQHLLPAVTRQCPASDAAGGKHGTGQAKQGAAFHDQSPSCALKPICTPRARASSSWCRRCSWSIRWYSASSCARLSSLASISPNGSDMAFSCCSRSA